jgi:hypothetical protein
MSCKRVFESIQLTPLIARSFWGSSLLSRLDIFQRQKQIKKLKKTRDLALGQDIYHG